MVAGILPLRLAGVELHRQGTRLLGPVTLEIGGRGLTIVIGPNGSGKTSLLRLMHGLERPSRGTIAWAVPEAAARMRQAYVFQTPTMMRRSVTDSIAYALTVGGTPLAEARAAARDHASRVGLGHALDRAAGVLSGGEKQKLALARALIRRPQILFLDEPCASLDGRATREIEAILTEARAAGTRIVMATHDLGQARRLADETIFLLEGRVHESCPAPAFFTAPQTAAGHAFINGQIVE